jgi:hypothetical protein
VLASAAKDLTTDNSHTWTNAKMRIMRILVTEYRDQAYPSWKGYFCGKFYPSIIRDRSHVRTIQTSGGVWLVLCKQRHSEVDIWRIITRKSDGFGQDHVIRLFMLSTCLRPKFSGWLTMVTGLLKLPSSPQQVAEIKRKKSHSSWQSSGPRGSLFRVPALGVGSAWIPLMHWADMVKVACGATVVHGSGTIPTLSGDLCRLPPPRTPPRLAPVKAKGNQAEMAVAKPFWFPFCETTERPLL